ncbi:uncharacterized protein LOC129093651 isoform X2 [Anoplopoma fimbria]|uniref:uncharacterized protein LOC129093651 isoform X2 n=1 Tax=Anoplopoma fimbria TaxID=229290 RepID=UPI0023EC174B|nr:uncharacterized protein LOC129093651 isoform X2 [Anoplopoma fimbria]
MTNRTYKQREKMICSILLLITLTSCVSGSFVVNVRQRSYQAEENHNITLEWTFSPRTDGSSKSIFIFCELLTDLGPFALFDLHKDLEVPESQHEWFSGRVQFDKDVLREGRLRLHMSRLRTADSGLYLCRVNIGYGWNSGQCRLNVTARDRPKPETPNTASGGRDASKTGSPSEPESPGWIVLYCGLGLLVAGLLLGVCYRLYNGKIGTSIVVWCNEQQSGSDANAAPGSENGSILKNLTINARKVLESKFKQKE